MRVEVTVVLCAMVCYGLATALVSNRTRVRNELEEKIGNFSIELLHHTSQVQPPTENLILAPMTVWAVLAAISEGAAGRTKKEINHLLRINSNKEKTRSDYDGIAKWLQAKTNTVELAKFNALFIDIHEPLLPDFVETSKRYYDTNLISLNFADNENAAKIVNSGISNVTHGRISNIVDANSFVNSKMLVTSAFYFKAQWSVSFDSSRTFAQPFYDSNGTKIGEVKMMYNRGNYPFAYIKALKARVLEIPYGKENDLSMIIILPNLGNSLESVFVSFLREPNTVFEELKKTKEKYPDELADCFLPRFRIKSSLDMTAVLSTRMGLRDLFDIKKARLPRLARSPLYISKIFHKAEIDVTEEGTAPEFVDVFPSRTDKFRVQANRPFLYIVVEKETNSIVFGGYYKQPSLY